MITESQRKELRRRISDLVEARSDFDKITDSLIEAIPSVFDERWQKLLKSGESVFGYIDELTLDKDSIPRAYFVHGIGCGKHYVHSVRLTSDLDDPSEWKGDDAFLGDYWAGNEAIK